MIMSNQVTVRRTIIVILIAVLAVVFSATVPGAKIHAATKYKLPSEIDEYEMDGDDIMQLNYKMIFKYNKKGDLTKMVIQPVYYSGPTETFTFKYTYKKGKKTKAVVKLNGKKNRVYKFDKKGRISKITTADGKWIWVYKYGKKGYLKTVRYTDPWETVTRKYTTTLKNGKATRIKFYQPEGDGDSWSRDTYYNKDELINIRYEDNFPLKYSYQFKNGLVSRIVTDNGNNKIRYDYKYSNKTVKKSKYVKVINRDERTVVGSLGR